MEAWQIWAMVGAILFYLIGIGVMVYFINKDKKENREFWDKYFRYLEMKSELIHRDIEAEKQKDLNDRVNEILKDKYDSEGDRINYPYFSKADQNWELYVHDTEYKPNVISYTMTEKKLGEKK